MPLLSKIVREKSASAVADSNSSVTYWPMSWRPSGAGPHLSDLSELSL